jgi:RecB family exonuclease
VIAALSDVRRARASLAQVLPVALREARASAGLAPPAAELARAQLAILDEIDAPVSRRASAGPYLGFVGTVDARDDPRRADLWVTHLESMAACPWRTFVERVLHLAPAPDPLSELSDIDARTLGLAIHAALDAVARVPHLAPGADLAQAVAVLPAPIAWPDEAELDALLADVAQRVLRDEGLALPGLERVLALRMRPYVEAARAIDRAERDDALGVLATEACGRVDIDDGCGGARSLSFVADRVDALRTGLRLTDFKTGKPFVPDGKPETRAKHFLQRVARGTHLQAAAYAAAAGDGARGSYLFLAPDVDARARRLAVEAADDAFRTAFRDATRILATAWRGGAFVPRLVDEKLEKEPRACSLCEVASACVRGDSGMRQRLTTWLRARRDDDARALDSAEAIGAAMWRMGAQANERAAAPGAE